jgi:hypothetical protein
MFQKLLRKILLTIIFAALASQASAMFIQADWLDPTEPGVGANSYAYSENDPVNKVDPSGNVFGDWFSSQEESDMALLQNSSQRGFTRGCCRLSVLA